MPGTVYLLGAGASHADTKSEQHPLPLSTHFLTQERIDAFWPHYETGIPAFSQSAVKKIITQYYGIDPYNSRCKINVEEIYSFLDSAPNFITKSYSDITLFSAARDELLKFIHISLPVDEISRHPFHSHIVGNLKKEDSIISLNWDCLIDYTLEESEIGFNLLKKRHKLLNPFGYNTSKIDLSKNESDLVNSGFFIKIHGSVGYITCKDHDCLHFESPLLLDKGEEGYPFPSCPSCGGPTEIYIVPPHIHKTYQQRRFSRLQARIAATKLSVADKIVIIGYSLPTYDFQVKTLLRLQRLEPWEVESSQCNLDEIIIVNPSIKNSMWLDDAINLLGLNNSEQSYGKEVKLSLYSSINKYMDNDKK